VGSQGAGYRLPAYHCAISSLGYIVLNIKDIKTVTRRLVWQVELVGKFPSTFSIKNTSFARLVNMILQRANTALSLSV